MHNKTSVIEIRPENENSKSVTYQLLVISHLGTKSFVVIPMPDTNMYANILYTHR